LNFFINLFNFHLSKFISLYHRRETESTNTINHMTIDLTEDSTFGFFVQSIESMLALLRIKNNCILHLDAIWAKTVREKRPPSDIA
jgi:hypothetical protein